MASRIPRHGVACLGALLLTACGQGRPAERVAPATATSASADAARFWNSATIYFLLTDRFHNGDSTNDGALGRDREGAVLRTFEGGDLAGVLQRIEEGYFDSLGVQAIWMTPFVEQIHGSVNEGTGKTYGFHGYWTRDWTAVDPALGTEDDLRAVVDAAHRHGIRVIMDAVINHTGPPTPQDPAWPDTWVRTEPNCTYRSYTTTVDCTLVKTLPDLRTDSDAAVELPPALLEKWEREGRREREVAELDRFFQRTGHPRAPRYYVIKWLTDWVRDLGFDGYRVDTAKHFEEQVSAELRREAAVALDDWRRGHPERIAGDLPFYMVGEVYGWSAEGGRKYGFGDRDVDYFAHGYDALINFGFKSDTGSMDGLFTRYAGWLAGRLSGAAVLNYISSHDDGSPYDIDRRDPSGAGTRLLLAPGGAQIYYGDEVGRALRVEGAEGDANLRSMMPWGVGGEVLEHWRKLGKFRAAHPAVGAGVHRMIQAEPYVFSRVLGSDRVVVALGMGSGEKTVPVGGVFGEGVGVVDGYSGARAVVRGGVAMVRSEGGIVLLGEGR